jgi:hypothetical protein
MGTRWRGEKSEKKKKIIYTVATTPISTLFYLLTPIKYYLLINKLRLEIEKRTLIKYLSPIRLLIYHTPQ